MDKEAKRDIPYSETGDKEEDEILLQPFIHLLRAPGKKIRGKLAHAFNYWLRIPEDKLALIREIIQILHNASLLLDDIEDNSTLRRGIPCAHSIHGVGSTINCANYAMFVALEKSFHLDHPEATSVCTLQLLELHRGQGMEIYWRDNFICPSEEQYKQMTIRKTGGLFMLAIKLMQLFSTNKKDFSTLSGILGLYFQIRDDYCNLCMEEYSDNKTYCEDLTEGKFSFPIIHAINNAPHDNQVMKIIRQRTHDVQVKRYCCSLLEKYGSFAYTRQILESLENDARREVEALGGNPHLEAILVELHNWSDPCTCVTFPAHVKLKPKLRPGESGEGDQPSCPVQQNISQTSPDSLRKTTQH